VTWEAVLIIPPTELPTDLRRFRLLFVVPTLLLLGASVWPLVTGSKTLFLRDVFNTHLEMKWMQAEAMERGTLPLIDDLRSGGQAHVGNPNTVPLYPDNLLYLFLPFFWAFNAHFWIHLLIAPFAMYWLAREWGLRREAAWAAGVVYATCGYYLSNYNFYNLVAGVTWAPALAAALIRSSKDRGKSWGFGATAVIWCLLLLAGDPIIAALAATLGGLSMIVLGGGGGRWKSGLMAGLLGSVIAAPQLVEFLRILPLTFRGQWGYSVESALTASWNPRTLLDWFVALPYGSPDFDFWGLHLFGDLPPLYYTFYPGLLATLFFLWSGLPRGRAVRLAWGWMLVGLFFSLGAHNPPLRWLLETLDFQLVRFPVKFWLFVGIGGALLCGHGVERWLAADEPEEARGARFGLLPVVALCGAAWLFVLWLYGAPELAESALRRLVPESFDLSFVEGERMRWAGLSVVVATMLTAATGLVAWGGRRNTRQLALAGLLVLHAGTQLWLLQPLLPTDDLEPYQQPHAALASVPEGSRVVNGQAGSLFGRAGIHPDRYPERTFVWLQRQTFSELYPAALSLAGLRYDLKISPEGLDSFRTRAASQAIQKLPDDARLRLLESWGTEFLILNRRPDSRVESRMELVEEFQNSVGDDIFVYRLRESVPSVRFVGQVLPQAALSEELRTLSAPSHDPRRAVIVPAGVDRVMGRPGRLETLENEPERWRGTVESSAGGAVVLQRTNLPILEARVDGERVDILDADLHRLAIPVPAGRHEVMLQVNRRPWYAAWVVALLALLELGLACRRMQA